MAMALLRPTGLDRLVNRVAKNGMRVAKKAEAMLDLWAMVKRAHQDVPRDRDLADDREGRGRRAADPAATGPVAAAE
ncbi:MAG TPA: hypothetical protein VFR85_09585 [Anaeromyxobacteraceae bacterium]|nr:hypothetical protein [Anaeromyxobacteraceae bacterium]